MGSMTKSLAENRSIKLHKFFLIRFQIQLIKEISNIITFIEFHGAFDLALLPGSKTSMVQNHQRFIKGTGRQRAAIRHRHPMG